MKIDFLIIRAQLFALSESQQAILGTETAEEVDVFLIIGKNIGTVTRNKIKHITYLKILPCTNIRIGFQDHK